MVLKSCTKIGGDIAANVKAAWQKSAFSGHQG